ncbi:hypothetical protein SCHPADRAFT_889369 [Schizopora paradoxa]|uniref:Uncharacterized protein n=1 Tax=Schizopora paradoxa TaxID=27342 RepID=A0A0H2RRY2_9AGAM|nr:hypothetical protein SCHPADRAFT_889369 [Schizopora paradoxa]
MALFPRRIARTIVRSDQLVGVEGDGGGYLKMRFLFRTSEVLNAFNTSVAKCRCVWFNFRLAFATTGLPRPAVRRALLLQARNLRFSSSFSSEAPLFDVKPLSLKQLRAIDGGSLTCDEAGTKRLIDLSYTKVDIIRVIFEQASSFQIISGRRIAISWLHEFGERRLRKTAIR